jgi:hypothetical protein
MSCLRKRTKLISLLEQVTRWSMHESLFSGNHVGVSMDCKSYLSISLNNFQWSFDDDRNLKISTTKSSRYPVDEDEVAGSTAQ